MGAEKEFIVLLTAMFTFLTAVGGGFVFIYKEVRSVHKVINSRMDELLELTRKDAHAEGVSDEKRRDMKGD